MSWSAKAWLRTARRLDAVARLPRLVVPGQPHHVLQQGNNGQAVFLTDDDRNEWLRMLHEAAREHALAVHAYALLHDHVRLLATPADTASLSRTMQAVGRRYVSRFNRLHHRSGTLWEGRFRCGVVEGERHLVNCMRFIESVPVQSGAAASPGDFAWSSAPHHLGYRRDPLITDHPEYWRLGNTPFDRQAAYRALLDEGLAERDAAALGRSARQGWALGSSTFLDQLAQATQRPLVPRRRGRPRATPTPD